MSPIAPQAPPTLPEPTGATGAGWRLRLASRAARHVGALARAARRARHRLLRRPGAPPARILVARRARLGDLVASLPLLEALRLRHPAAQIEIGGIDPEPALVLALAPDRADTLRRFDEDPRRSALRGALDALRLAARGYDVLVTGERFGLLRASLLCGAPIRIGFDDGHPLRSLCTRLVAFDSRRHAADNLRALADALGPGPAHDAASVPDAAGDSAPRIDRRPFSAPDTRAALRRRLALPEEACVIALHPGAQKPSRRWPAERFARLAERLLARDPQRWIAITGGPDEVALASAVRSAVPHRLRARICIAAGRTDLAQLFALIADARLLICNDTGVLHVARALGTPLLALLGPENDRVWGPHPRGGAAAISIRHRVPCAPCKRFECERLYCLRSLPVEEAQREAERLLAGGCAPGLRRVETPHDWRSLASAGFTLPEVAIAPPGSNGRAPDARAAARARREDLAGELGEAVARLQRDPRLSCVPLDGADAPSSGASGPAAVLFRTPHGTLELRPHG